MDNRITQDDNWSMTIVPSSQYKWLWRMTFVSFSQGNWVWRMSNVPDVDDGYPRRISEEFSDDIPNDIDAAFVWKRNRKNILLQGVPVLEVRL